MKKTFFASLTIIFSITILCHAEFQVNTNTNDIQEYPAIAMDGTGNFVVVWRSKHTGSRGTYGQRFSADGTPIGSQFQTNTTSVGGRVSTGPSVAMDSVGNFVVVWTGYRDGEENIIARRYTSSGAPITGEFVVNTNTHADFENSHIGPSIAMNPSGAFVIVWEAWHGDDGHNGTWGAYGRAYDSSGNPRGDEFQINQIFHNDTPDVVIDDSGDFVVAWIRFGDINNLPYGSYIRFRMYHGDGTPKGGAIQVTTDDIGSYNNGTAPSLAMAKNGNFIITWCTNFGLSSYDAYAQRFDNTGVSIGGPFKINSYTDDSQIRTSVAMHTDGQFVIVWSSEGQDGSDYGIFGQLYSKDGMPVENEFQINTYTSGRQLYPYVAMKDSGEFITAWQSDGQDGDNYGIFGEFGQFPGPIAGDCDGDRDVDGDDFAEFMKQWLLSRLSCDVGPDDGDGIVDFVDWAVFADEWQTTTDASDLADFASQWLQDGCYCADIAPAPDGDGIVDMLDFAAFANNWLEGTVL